MNLDKIKQYSGSLIIFMLCLIVYALILVVPIPSNTGLSIRYDFSSVLATIFLISLAAYSLPGKWGKAAGMLVAFGIFGLALAGLWGGAKSEFGVIEGLLPWSDANGYYIGAQRLIEGNLFSSLASRRPLFPGLLSILLWADGLNLQGALAVLVAFNALAAGLLSYEVRKSHGGAAAGLTLTLLFVFYRRFAGMTLTENLGLPLGCLGFAALWGSAHRTGSWKAALAGLFFMTMALITRAGAFFILPALAIWAALYLKKRGKPALRGLAVGILVIAVGFGLNAMLMRIVTVPDSQAFSNFSTTFYGLAAGGKGWLQVEKDHPEINNLPIQERANKVYQLAFDEIKENPVNLARGMGSAWRNFFEADDLGMFGFVKGANPGITRAARIALLVLAVIGLISALLRRRDGVNSMVTAAWAGIFISIPFVPPGDADYMRAYAATIPFSVILPVLGMHGLLKAAKIPWLTRSRVDGKIEPAIFALGFFAIFLAVIGPLAIKIIAQPPKLGDYTCTPGQDRVTMRIIPGSYVMLVDDDQVTRLPEIRWNDFTRSAHDHPEWLVTTELDRLTPVTLLADQLDIYANQGVYLMIKVDLLPAELPALLNICGTWSENKRGRGYGFFIGKSASPIPGG